MKLIMVEIFTAAAFLGCWLSLLALEALLQ